MGKLVLLVLSLGSIVPTFGQLSSVFGFKVGNLKASDKFEGALGFIAFHKDECKQEEFKIFERDGTFKITLFYDTNSPYVIPKVFPYTHHVLIGPFTKTYMSVEKLVVEICSRPGSSYQIKLEKIE